MYLPYLRGKQFELLALRSFANNNPNCTSIIPIIEPVKRSPKNLELAFKEMIVQGLKFALILNPSDGDFKHPIDNDIIQQYPILTSHIGEWIPAYFYHNKGSKILEHAQNYGLNNLMLIPSNTIDFEDINLINLLNNQDVHYVVVSNGSRSTRAKLIRMEKEVISLEDRFKTRLKNADYGNPDDEFYSDDFAYYQEDKLWGYSDYTTIGKDFMEGGMLPYAIAIHLTYQKSEDTINVHHFVSESNYDQTNIRGKFVEAAQKIEPFYEKNKIKRTPVVDELISKSQSYEGYPGLGYLKKLSILNHLELINNLSQ